MKINRLFFTEFCRSANWSCTQCYILLVGTNLLKRTQQWSTASKCRGLCHKTGQSILNTLKFVEARVCHTWQKRIAIIEVARHKSTCEQFCTIRIKITSITPPIPNMVKARNVELIYMWEKSKMFVKILQDYELIWLVNFDNILRYLLRCRPVFGVKHRCGWVVTALASGHSSVAKLLARSSLSQKVFQLRAIFLCCTPKGIHGYFQFRRLASFARYSSWASWYCVVVTTEQK